MDRFNISPDRRRARIWRLLAVGAVVTCLICGSVAQAAPRFEAEQPTVDLGEVTRGEIVEAEFAFSNPGDTTLRITRVNPG